MNTKHPYWPDLTDDEGDALSEWFDDTCGDCLEGRCHWGGETSQRSIDAADSGVDFEHPTFGRCGCSRHGASVLARPFQAGYAKAASAALEWRAAKERGEVVAVEDDDGDVIRFSDPTTLRGGS